MNSLADSSDRDVADLALFALGFIALLIGVAGVVVSSPPIAFLGLAGLVFLLIIIRLRRSPDEE